MNHERKTRKKTSTSRRAKTVASQKRARLERVRGEVKGRKNRKAKNSGTPRSEKTAIRTIDVIVEGGVIQEILHIPSGIKVRVIDFDIEGSSETQPSPYDSEHECLLSTWYGASSEKGK